MSNLTRRAMARFLGAAPVVGRAVLQSGTGVGTSIQGSSLLSNVASGAEAGDISNKLGLKPATQQMSHAQAVAKFMADPIMRRQLEELAWKNNRIVHAIDDDLAAMRSFSHMAKITFQRQRNVEREIREAGEPPPWEARNVFEQMIRKFIWGTD